MIGRTWFLRQKYKLFRKCGHTDLCFPFLGVYYTTEKAGKAGMRFRRIHYQLAHGLQYIVVGALLWVLCCGCFAVDALLWMLCCGCFAVGAFFT